MPVYVAGWDARALKARIVFGAQDQQELVAPQDAQERRYALRTVKQRLHQASFREAVISAYRGRCSLSGLSEKPLLDAAHIIASASASPYGSVRTIRKLKVQKQPQFEAGIRQDHFDLCRGSLPVHGGQSGFQLANRRVTPVVIQHAIDFIPARIVSQFIPCAFQ